jgi:hypothetical protein
MGGIFRNFPSGPGFAYTLKLTQQAAEYSASQNKILLDFTTSAQKRLNRDAGRAFFCWNSNIQTVVSSGREWNTNGAE